MVRHEALRLRVDSTAVAVYNVTKGKAVFDQLHDSRGARVIHRTHAGGLIEIMTHADQIVI